MHFHRRLRTATASCLFTLLGVLGTGLPSHHHDDGPAVDSASRISSADHHTHGTRLVDQERRAPAAGLQFVALPGPADLYFPEPIELAPPLRSSPLRATERAPPAAAPRAPPFRI